MTSTHSLVSVARMALEDWGMMFVDEDVSTTPLDGDLVAHTDIQGLSGKVGTIIVLAPFGFAASLRGSLLGDVEVALDDPENIDAVRELANVIAGHYVTECLDPDDVFELLPPQAQADAQSVGSTEFDECVVFGCEGENVTIIYRPKAE
jgi:hypothetical protein